MNPKPLSANAAKWNRFLHNPRAAFSLALLSCIFLLSLFGGFFLPSPSAVIDPASIAPFRHTRLRIAPAPITGRLDIKPDYSISAISGSTNILPNLSIGSSLLSLPNLPPALTNAIARRFANITSPATNITLNQTSIEFLEYKTRPKPPRSIRTRISFGSTKTQKSWSLSYRLNANNSLSPTLLSRHTHHSLLSSLSAPSQTNFLALLQTPHFLNTNAPSPPLSLHNSNSPLLLSSQLEPVTWPFRPVPGHPFGIDNAGRDVLARIVAGTRIALLFGLLLVASSIFIGIAAGAVQGYYGGIVDIATQRFIEIWSSLPFLYVMILVGSVLGRSFSLLLFCYGLFNWIGISYYMRAEFLRLRARPFVEAARCQGLSSWRIIWHHILPNALTPIITLLPFCLIGAISSISALDFLGFGLPPLTPSLGELLSEAQQDSRAWWLIVFPSCTLFSIMLLSVFIGEGLRDAFDPKPTARYR